MIVPFHLALSLVLHSAAPDPDKSNEDIPLTMPTKGPKPEASNVENATPDREPLGIASLPKSSPLMIAVHAGAGFGTRDPARFSFEAAVEIGYKLPLASRVFAVSGWLGFAYGTGDFRSPVGRFKTNLVAGDFAALASFAPALGPGRFRIALGPALSITSLKAVLNRSESTDSGIGLGFIARAGYLFTLRARHAVGAEFGYHARPYAVTGLSSTDHVFVLALTYLWS